MARHVKKKSLKKAPRSPVISATPLSANISTIKDGFTRFLREVRKGQTITVLDRDHPVAQIIPFVSGEGMPLETIASRGSQRLGRYSLKEALKHQKISPVELDSTLILEAERRSR